MKMMVKMKLMKKEELKKPINKLGFSKIKIIKFFLNSQMH